MPQYAIVRFAKQKVGAGALKSHHERTKEKYVSEYRAAYRAAEEATDATTIGGLIGFDKSLLLRKRCTLKN